MEEKRSVEEGWRGKVEREGEGKEEMRSVEEGWRGEGKEKEKVSVEEGWREKRTKENAECSIEEE